MSSENKKTPDDSHEWDGITEQFNPEPTWIRYFFYITLFFSLGYWIFYPSWPTPNSSGILNWTSDKEVTEQTSNIISGKSQYQETFNKSSWDDVYKDPKLLAFATQGGRSLFQENCAPCHGRDAKGRTGYPNLTDNEWIWGGKLDDIDTTIRYGIRSNHPDTRDSQMAAFGDDKILTSQQITLLTNYIINKMPKEMDDARTIFEANCSSCHGADGSGNQQVGAPSLIDDVWLYGNQFEEIYNVIYHGKGGVMPAWVSRLSDSSIKQLAIYVKSLSTPES